MNDNDINEIKLTITNGQIIGLFLFVLTLFISILLAYNEKLNLENKNPLFNDDDVLIIAIINRIVVVALGLYFVYTTLINKELDNNDNIPVFTSLLALLASLVGLYDLFRNYQRSNNVNITDDLDLPVL